LRLVGGDRRHAITATPCHRANDPSLEPPRMMSPIIAVQAFLRGGGIGLVGAACFAISKRQPVRTIIDGMVADGTIKGPMDFGAGRELNPTLLRHENWPAPIKNRIPEGALKRTPEPNQFGRRPRSTPVGEYDLTNDLFGLKYAAHQEWG
jgi:hypothetical protein